MKKKGIPIKGKKEFRLKNLKKGQQLQVKTEQNHSLVFTRKEDNAISVSFENEEWSIIKPEEQIVLVVDKCLVMAMVNQKKETFFFSNIVAKILLM